MTIRMEEVEKTVTMMEEGYLTSYRPIDQMLNRVASIFGVGWSTLSILFQISKDSNVTMSELARKNGISKGAISLQINELLNRKLIRVKEDSADRRRHLIILTKKGENVSKRAGESAATIAENVLNQIGFDEMMHLHETFTRFAKAASEVPIE